MGMSLGLYSFGECFPKNHEYCYILDANYTIEYGVDIKRGLFYLVHDYELNKKQIHIEYEEDNYSSAFGYLDNPKWNLLSNMYWISEKDYLNSFST
jgi:hypothetical protein